MLNDNIKVVSSLDLGTESISQLLDLTPSQMVKSICVSFYSGFISMYLLNVG